MLAIAEQERLLQRAAKRELEKQGYKLFSNKTGGFQIQSAIDGKIVAGKDFEMTVYDVGRFAGICGYSTASNVKADLQSAEMARARMISRQTRVPDEKDPITGLNTPEYAAALEKMNGGSA